MKRIYRSKKEKKLLGVCGGIAEALDVDPTLIRLIWVIATIFSGFMPGTIAYFVAWFIMPKAPQGN
jgi:phage shock protein C